MWLAEKITITGLDCKWRPLLGKVRQKSWSCCDGRERKCICQPCCVRNVVTHFVFVLTGRKQKRKQYRSVLTMRVNGHAVKAVFRQQPFLFVWCRPCAGFSGGISAIFCADLRNKFTIELKKISYVRRETKKAKENSAVHFINLE